MARSKMRLTLFILIFFAVSLIACTHSLEQATGTPSPTENPLPSPAYTDTPTLLPTSTVTPTYAPTETPSNPPPSIQIVEPVGWNIPPQSPEALAQVLATLLTEPNSDLPKGDPLTISNPDLAHAFLSNPMAADLLRDHRIIANVYRVTERKTIAEGDITLVGQAVINGQTLLYSIKSPFLYRDDELIYWTLSRDKLLTMLEDIFVNPFMNTFRESHPLLILNMFYAEHDPFEMIYQPAGLVQEWSICGEEMSSLPTETEPLRGFGFTDDYWVETHHFIDFLLIDGKPQIYDIWDASPHNENRPTSAYYDYLPPELRVDDYPLIGAFQIRQSGGTGSLSFLAAPPPTEEEIAQLQPFAEQFPVSIEFFAEEYTIALARGIGFRIPDEGPFEMIVCEDQDE